MKMILLVSLILLIGIVLSTLTSPATGAIPEPRPCQVKHSDKFCAVKWHQRTIRKHHDKSLILVNTQYGYIDAPPIPRITWRLDQLKSELTKVLVGQKKILAYVAKPWSSKIPRWDSWICIHRGEGAWNSNTGNGYFGGLQMDRSFMSTYGSDITAIHNGGLAETWTPIEQIIVAERAWVTRGFYPWPQTARVCGLI